MFHSHVCYGLHLWGHSGRLGDVLLLQKKAVRVLTGSDYMAHCRPLFKRLKMLTVVNQYILECLVRIRDRARSADTRGGIHGYGTRQTHLINMPRCRLARTQRSYPFIAFKMFNKLPEWVKDSGSDRQFRAVLRSLLVEHPFYSLSEFLDSEMTF
ncbi:uncharacterized protein LOC120351872 [Nilaparvata lugens]|uniref:uncharacterized protein LOC120351852 n=1 Tax=Nilaparvata lugens TaxID=108931 RepID=UPI00193E17DE|nr:uncharacterized protein LOC120351852 [Nilaparvata lugens]XP_039286527.1 uncharacterized protein LOC120351872 [Nilaparvata lugens]